MATCVEVIWPAPDWSTIFAGRPRLGWFNALKFSQRNSRVLPSATVKVFASARFTSASRGPRRLLRCTNPSRYGCNGAVKAAGLYQRVAFGCATLGSPIWSGRTLLKSALTLDELETSTVNGMPE